MIAMKFAATPDGAAAWVEQKREAIAAGAARGMSRATIALQRTVMETKLSGQVLKNRTGNLRRSITQQVIAEQDQIRGVVGVDRTAWYGKLHEYGATVSATSRRGKSYTIHFKERSFLRSSLAEQKDRILDELRGAVSQAVEA